MSSNSPQFPVERLSSTMFLVDFTSKPMDDDEELLFVESILCSLVDSFGDRFHATLISNKTSNNLYTLSLKFNKFKWLWDFSYDVDTFLKENKEMFDLNVVKVYITPTVMNNDGVNRYTFLVKDGIFEEKKVHRRRHVLGHSYITESFDF